LVAGPHGFSYELRIAFELNINQGKLESFLRRDLGSRSDSILLRV
jgi:hypothetical protein